MEKVTFFDRQQSLRRLTVRLLVLTVIGSVGIACLGGVATGLTHYQLVTRTQPTVDPTELMDAALVGAAGSFSITLLAVFIQLVMLSFSRTATRRFFHARDLTDESTHGTLASADQQLMNVVDEMTLAAATPRLGLFVLDDDPSINSFALSTGAESSIIGVTSGAMRNLSREELQAVIAHEIAHITNGDAAINIRLLALIRGFRWLYDASVAIIGYPMRKLSSFKVGLMLMFYLTMVFGVFFVLGLFGVGIARLMQAAIARQREYLADASAIQFTRSTKGLLGALEKAGAFKQSRKHRPTHTAAFMMFVSPYRARSWLLRTHPKIEQRVEAARAMTPGMAPWGTQPNDPAMGLNEGVNA